MTSRPLIAGFITGHSVRGCTGLSEEQAAFQRRTNIPIEDWLLHNFPYAETFPFPARFSILAASWNNVGHYLQSRRPAFAQAHREAVSGLFNQHDKVLLLAGSCGLELLNNLDLPPEIRQRVHVFAYGPVSRRLPAVASCVVVQGTRDWLSRFYHFRADHRYPCPHMGYLQSPETLRLFNEYYQRVISS